jgi:hypothetical protein
MKHYLVDTNVVIDMIYEWFTTYGSWFRVHGSWLRV